MKRDMELIRLLLLEKEADKAPPELSQYSDADIIYNYELMDDAGLIVATFTKDSSGIAVGASCYKFERCREH